MMSNNRTKKKYDLSSFNYGIVVKARLTGLNIVFKVYTENMKAKDNK